MIQLPKLVGGKVLGVGTDIVHLPRMIKLLQKYPSSLKQPSNKLPNFDRIASKFMHNNEIKYLHELLLTNEPSSHRIVNYVGGIWAIKEASLKALSCYTPTYLIPPAKTVYTKLLYKTNTSNGAPVVKIDPTFLDNSPLHSKFYQDYINEQKRSILVSISHDQDYLIALTCITELETKQKQ